MVLGCSQESSRFGKKEREIFDKSKKNAYTMSSLFIYVFHYVLFHQKGGVL